MAESMIRVAVAAFYGYAIVGLVFAAAFVTTGVSSMDKQAHGAGLGFRLIIFPGVAAFWPLLLYRWIRGSGAAIERTPHR
jgi:hypothetical protein